MSTRANVAMMDKYGDLLWFYRHSDGYPEGALPTLKKFMEWLAAGKIRSNTNQSAGWLVILGAAEYNHSYDKNGNRTPGTLETLTAPQGDAIGTGWKAGAYEPTVGIHGDIEYCYVLDLERLVILVYDSETGFPEDPRKHDRKPAQTIEFKRDEVGEKAKAFDL